MTEDEAKTKWCPLTSLRTNCLAFACMAWRTRPIRTHVNHVTRDGTSAVAVQPEDIVTLDGYCGLAGAPQ